MVTAGVLAVVVAALTLAFVWIRRTGLPEREGVVHIPGLGATVEVRYDAWGVPHLRADSTEDLAAALGYVHANDRMAQMELGRRTITGRLSELLGNVTIESDITARRLRFRKEAEALWENVRDTEEGRLQEAYARGVNAYLARRGTDLPPTLRLLGIDPEPWTPPDTIGFSFLMARNLSLWQGRPEELRLAWLSALGVERTRDLLGLQSLHVAPGLPRLATTGVHPAAEPAEIGGSNNWILGASRTAAGVPLLANDPHLGLRLPGIWYEAYLRAPGLEVGGMTVAGVFGVIIGQNRDLAWGMTNVMLDDLDVFFEVLDDEGLRVRRGGGWIDLERETEKILVKGSQPVELELLRSDLGPVLPADPKLDLPPRSFAWTCYHQTDPFEAFFTLARAKTVADLRPGIESYVCPAQNLVAADSSGGLFYATLGRIPRRRAGDGWLPMPAWEPAYGWDGVEEFEAGVIIEAPETDFLVTANHDIRPAGYVGPLTGNFDVAARANRIRELLLSARHWTPEQMISVQSDVRSRYAQDLVGALEGPFTGDAYLAHAELSSWDGSMTATGASALFAVFERQLAQLIFEDELDLPAVSDLVTRNWLDRLMRRQMSEAWFDDITTERKEGRREIVTRALDWAWKDALSRWGKGMKGWRYGEIHPLEFRHPLSVVPVLGQLVNRGPFPMTGSATTVAAFGGPWEGDVRPVVYGPSMRWVAVPGNPEAARVIVPAGQSGHPFDRHYDDQMEMYLDNVLREVAWSEAEIARATVSTLRLEP